MKLAWPCGRLSHCRRTPQVLFGFFNLGRNRYALANAYGAVRVLTFHEFILANGSLVCFVLAHVVAAARRHRRSSHGFLARLLRTRLGGFDHGNEYDQRNKEH